MNYNQGDVVWLKEFLDGDEIVKHQAAVFMGYGRNETCVVRLYNVELEPGDDGLRELLVEDIEGLV